MPRNIGIDIGGTWCRTYLFDEDYTVLAQSQTSTPMQPELLTPTIVEQINLITPDGDFASIGVAIPGAVDIENGTVSNAVNLNIPDSPFGLRHKLESSVGKPVRLVNDANAATIGARTLLAGLVAPNETTAYVGIGTGLGVGIISGGQLQTGHSGLAGEYGHIPYGSQGLLCKCGQLDCLELYCSGSALERLGVRLGSPSEHPSANEITFVKALVWLLETICLTIDPAVIQIGGGVAAAREHLELRLQEQLTGASGLVKTLDILARISWVGDAPVGAIGTIAEIQ